MPVTRAVLAILCGLRISRNKGPVAGPERIRSAKSRCCLLGYMTSLYGSLLTGPWGKAGHKVGTVTCHPVLASGCQNSNSERAVLSLSDRMPKPARCLWEAPISRPSCRGMLVNDDDDRPNQRKTELSSGVGSQFFTSWRQCPLSLYTTRCLRWAVNLDYGMLDAPVHNGGINCLPKVPQFYALRVGQVNRFRT